MEYFAVTGGRPLAGEVRVHGAKNSALPILAATLLVRGESVIHNCPALTDIQTALDILSCLGCQVRRTGETVTVDAAHLTGTAIPDELMGRMRASVLFLGALLARQGEASACWPGGCALGRRPIDLHIRAFQALGAQVETRGEHLRLTAARLAGRRLSLPFPSVGATENAMLAACGAAGLTRICNAAREPEIVELCSFLRSMGAKISGERTGTITVDGVEKLFPTDHVTAGDRICAGTYLAAAAAAGGEIEITGVDPVVLVEPLKALRKMGAGIRISGATGPKARIGMVMERRPAGVEIDTGPYPGFPTDLQSVFLAVEAAGSGESRFKETVYEARFEAAMRLAAFGADVSLHKDTAIIRGRYPLVPGIAETPDLRGGAALLVAALAADGLSVISDSGHLKRGYEDIGRDLRKLGADIEEDEL